MQIANAMTFASGDSHTDVIIYLKMLRTSSLYREYNSFNNFAARYKNCIGTFLPTLVIS